MERLIFTISNKNMSGEINQRYRLVPDSKIPVRGLEFGKFLLQIGKGFFPVENLKVEVFHNFEAVINQERRQT